MTHSLVARAPTRIDFGGGWTDVPPYCEEQGGYVCNVAIARYATVRLSQGDADAESAVVRGTKTADTALALAAARRAGVDDIHITIESDFPVGAGLGGSSAAGVAAVGALASASGRALRGAELAEASRALEVEDLGIAGGRQDHYAAAFGGLLGLRFTDRTEVEPIALAPGLARALERRCILAYTGQSRISSRTITAVLDAYRDRRPAVVHALARIGELAREMATALRRESIDDLGRLVEEHWSHQRALDPAITTPLIDRIIERTAAEGALGAKALGASGGGCVVVIARDDSVDAVREAVATLAVPLPYAIDAEGFRLVREERAMASA